MDMFSPSKRRWQCTGGGALAAAAKQQPAVVSDNLSDEEEKGLLSCPMMSVVVPNC